jgi:hypothetical protein
MPSARDPAALAHTIPARDRAARRIEARQGPSIGEAFGHRTGMELSVPRRDHEVGRVDGWGACQVHGVGAAKCSLPGEATSPTASSRRSAIRLATPGPLETARVDASSRLHRHWSLL